MPKAAERVSISAPSANGSAPQVDTGIGASAQQPRDLRPEFDENALRTRGLVIWSRLAGRSTGMSAEQPGRPTGQDEAPRSPR